MSSTSATAITTATPHLKRVLGRWDLMLLIVVAVTNLNIVPVVAAGGAVTIWLWLLAIAGYFVPQGVAVIALSHRYPGEAGVYLWPKKLLGEVHGFVAGWSYWISNVFYVPSLLLYFVSVSVYVAGGRALELSENRLFVLPVSLGLLWLLVGLNVLGLSVGKWVNNIGGAGTIFGGIILVGLAAWAWRDHGSNLSVTDFRLAGTDWRLVSTFGLACFALLGLELGSDMGDEIRDPLRVLPGAVFRAGVISALLYVICTLALLVAMPQKDIGVVKGIMEAVSKMVGNGGLHWIVPALALVLSISVAGVAAAWLEGPARIIFAAGLDRYLPSALGKVHPRFSSPYVSLILYGVLCSIVIVMSFAGVTVKEAYLTMLDLAVILGLLQYVYMYASLIRFASGKEPASSYYYKRGVLLTAGVIGFVTTSLGMILAFIPSRQIDSIWKFEAKLIFFCALFLGVGLTFFWINSGRNPRQTHISLGEELDASRGDS